jgi:hypothetical protein
MKKANTAFAMISAYMLSCSDAGSLLDNMSFILSKGVPNGEKVIAALQKCLSYLDKKVKSENPYKINGGVYRRLGKPLSHVHYAEQYISQRNVANGKIKFKKALHFFKMRAILFLEAEIGNI